MRIVHLSTNASGGGAAIATLRIHQRLLARGVDSVLLVMNDPVELLDAVQIVRMRTRDKLHWRWDALARTITGGKHSSEQRAGFTLNRKSFYPVHVSDQIHRADVVSLYWVGHGFISPRQLRAFGKPLIWRLSDMWPFTGGCHYSFGCERYTARCGACPQLASENDRDETRILWETKTREWQDLGISIVSPSTWIQERALRSSLFHDKEHHLIATGVDEEVFRPRDRSSARKALGIEGGQVAVLFGAINADPRKGLQHLERLVLQDTNQAYRFFVFGPAPSEKNLAHKRVKFLGTITDEAALSKIYSAADVFLAPSLEDNLPNTVLESMACGTPVVSFSDSGGVIDVITHRETGYLAQRDKSDDLNSGIWWAIEANRNGCLSKKIRARIVGSFTLDQQVDQYISLYSRLIANRMPDRRRGKRSTTSLLQ